MDKRKNKKTSGQSLVELALVMPILVILLAGLAEVGWYAYRYIALQDTTRAIARAATTLYGEMSPIYWEDRDTGFFRGSAIVQPGDANYTPWLAMYRNCRASDPTAQFGFYNTIACIGLQTMNPLRIDRFEPGESLTDDIIISAFTIVPEDQQMRITQRYPTNAASCDPNNIKESLGFVWGGNYINSQGCLGSEFTNAEVEDMINSDNFAIETYDRTLLQPQGVVLVEIHWEHETLTQLVGLSPVLSPVLAAIGVSPVISTWSAFPLPQVERGLPDA